LLRRGIRNRGSRRFSRRLTGRFGFRPSRLGLALERFPDDCLRLARRLTRSRQSFWANILARLFAFSSFPGGGFRRSHGCGFGGRLPRGCSLLRLKLTLFLLLLR